MATEFKIDVMEKDFTEAEKLIGTLKENPEQWDEMYPSILVAKKLGPFLEIIVEVLKYIKQWIWTIYPALILRIEEIERRLNLTATSASLSTAIQQTQNLNNSQLNTLRNELASQISELDKRLKELKSKVDLAHP